MNIGLQYFSLFSNCSVVTGANIASICDLQYGNLYVVPKEVVVALNKIKRIPNKQYHKVFNSDELKILYKYLVFFEENDLGFWTNSPALFPELNNQWKHASAITNSIVEINEKINLKVLKKIINELDNLNCKSIEIRFVSKHTLSKSRLVAILDLMKNSGLQHVQVVVKSSFSYIEKDWFNIFIEYPRLYDVFLFNSNQDLTSQIINNRSFICFKEEFQTNKCGVVNRQYFSINTRSFTESHHHNSCLNRKISIDVDGNIKNCPSMPQSFGNIKDTTLQEALAHKDFKKYWNITKDQIDICKDCEFRYICTDCRAYKEDPENDYSKPLKCGYNPYTNEWEEWSTNPLKQKAIQYYGMQELVKKND